MPADSLMFAAAAPRGRSQFPRTQEQRGMKPQSDISDPRIIKEAVIGAALGQVGSDVRAAATAGGFGLPDAHLTRQRFRVDAKGWSDVSAELAKTLERVKKISEDSKKRLAKGGHDDDRDSGV